MTPEPFRVQLEIHEFLDCIHNVGQRWAASIHRNHNTGNRSRSWLELAGDSLRSFVAERAWAKACHTYWDTGIDRFTTDDAGDLRNLCGHGIEPGLQRASLRRSRGVIENRFVVGSSRIENLVFHDSPFSRGGSKDQDLQVPE